MDMTQKTRDLDESLPHSCDEVPSDILSKRSMQALVENLLRTGSMPWVSHLQHQHA